MSRPRPKHLMRAVIMGLAMMGTAAMAQTGDPAGVQTGDKDAPIIARAPATRLPGQVPRTRLGDPAPTEPQGLITAISAAEMIAALTAAGLPARWVTAGEGERILVAQLDGETPFQVLLQDCVSAQNQCVDFELSFGVSMAKPPSADQINSWNRDKTWAAFAYLTPQGAPALRAQYTLAGGISSEHLRILLKAWAASLRGFLTHISYTAGSARAVPAKP